MKKKMILVLLLFGIVNLVQAADFKELDTKAIKEIQSSLKMDTATRALMNAITNNDVKDLVLNRDLVNKHDNIYNLKVKAKGITNQKSTGRCWMFAGLNMLRPKMMEKFNLESFEFSQSYLFFWDKLEKANFLLETMIETKDRDIDDRELQALLASPVPDGGWWNYFVTIVEKYGVVPKDVMPENANSNKSSRMNKTIDNLVRQYAAELRSMAASGKNDTELRRRKTEMIKDVYRILVLHFDLPPKKFVWRFENKDKKIVEKEYTPQSFFRKAVDVDLEDYVALVDYPNHKYNEKYQINFCRNMPEVEDMTFINLNIEKLKTYALKSLQKGEPVWFAADAGWQMERKMGIMADGIYDYKSLFSLKDGLSKADMINYRVSIANHAMVFVGADVKDNKVVKWKVENSWGSEHGNKGYWAMYDSWFNKYVYVAIINKKYISKEDLNVLKKKAKKIPAWDPLRNFF